MENKQYFQFTLGPVQGFVAQARRTRDFWAGSFILSWLSSTAMACIEQQGGIVEFPIPSQDYMNWLTQTGERNGIPPQQGSIPNRFKAGVSAIVPADFNPELVTQTVQAAWQAIAHSVWQGDLLHLTGTETQSIWQRQINNFWEISWILSDSTTASGSLLDQRKNWRNTVAPNEPGHKCMMMDGWQELSGVTQTNLTLVNNFWAKLTQQNLPNRLSGIKTDLREKEQLCAIAYIKRRFARYFSKVSLTIPGTDKQLYGWTVTYEVPSVALLAAAPWLAQVIEQAPIDALQQFHDAAKPLRANYDEYPNVTESAFPIDIKCITQAAKQRVSDGFQRKWAGLDGQVYFPTALDNPNLFEDQVQAGKAKRALADLVKASGLTDSPSPYYAVLLMDGDQLGKHMGFADRQQTISQALNEFTQGVGEVVRDYDGFLVYAGGDDVLAVLPMEQALAAAAALQAFYKSCFAKQERGDVVRSTLSGAIQFTHIRTPLTRVLENAHQLLDQVAKDQVGRDAIAVRVWKPSGLAVEWAMPWQHALNDQSEVKIVQLAKQFAEQSNESNAFSNSFFYRFENVLERFPEADLTVLTKLVAMEFSHSFAPLKREPDLPQLFSLLEQCQNWQRADAEQPFSINKSQPLTAEGAMLVRFLAQKGIEREASL